MHSVSPETVEQHLPLIRTIARQVARGLPRHVSLDELVNAGTLGLYDAAARYSEDQGERFDRFAAFRIRGAMLDALRGMDWLSRRDRMRVRDGLLDDVGTTNLERDRSAHGDRSDPVHALAAREQHANLAEALSELPPRQRLVLSLYYLEELTLREIAAMLEVSESRVCQIHRGAIEALRRTMCLADA